LFFRRFAAAFSWEAAPLIAVLALLVFVPSFALLLPRLDSFWLSRSAAALVEAHAGAASGPTEAVGYDEPSLVFLLGGRLRSTTADDAIADLAARPGTLALVAQPEEAAFAKAAVARGLALEALGAAQGVNYSRSLKPLRLTLYARRPN
jgi:hypothetical protein